MENQVYLVTTVTRDRSPHFEHLQSGRIVVRALHYAEVSGCVSTLAYVVMPDHVHWLLQLSDNVSLSGVAGKMKRHTSGRINELVGKNDRHIWQRGFHDHALRKDEDVKSVARYIVANPLRAGLVKRVGDYALWDAVWL